MSNSADHTTSSDSDSHHVLVSRRYSGIMHAGRGRKRASLFATPHGRVICALVAVLVVSVCIHVHQWFQVIPSGGVAGRVDVPVQAAPCEQTPSGQTTVSLLRASAATPAPAYRIFSSMQTDHFRPIAHFYPPPLLETSYQVHILRHGGNSVQWRWRPHSEQQLIDDHTASRQAAQTASSIGADAFLWFVCLANSARVQALASEHPEWASRQLIVLEISDESAQSQEQLYKQASVSFRHYIHPELPQHLYYLGGVGVPAHARVRLQWNAAAHTSWLLIEQVLKEATDEAVPLNESAVARLICPSMAHVHWLSDFPHANDEGIVRDIYERFRQLPTGIQTAVQQRVEKCMSGIEALHLMDESEPWHSPMPYLADRPCGWRDANLSHHAAPLPPHSIMWEPLGFAPNVLMDFASAGWAPTSTRPQLLTWIGDIGGAKPERLQVKQTMDKATNEAQAANQQHAHRTLAQGVHIHGTSKFNADDVTGLAYTQALLDGRFTPLPAGMSAEQFRAYDSLYLGMHPIVLKHHTVPSDMSKAPPLQYLSRLALDPIIVDKWEHLAAVLLQLDMLPLHMLDQWQAVRAERLDAITKQLGRTLAAAAIHAAWPRSARDPSIAP